MPSKRTACARPVADLRATRSCNGRLPPCDNDSTNIDDLNAALQDPDVIEALRSSDAFFGYDYLEPFPVFLVTLGTRSLAVGTGCLDNPTACSVPIPQGVANLVATLTALREGADRDPFAAN